MGISLLAPGATVKVTAMAPPMAFAPELSHSSGRSCKVPSCAKVFHTLEPSLETSKVVWWEIFMSRSPSAAMTNCPSELVNAAPVRARSKTMPLIGLPSFILSCRASLKFPEPRKGLMPPPNSANHPTMLTQEKRMETFTGLSVEFEAVQTKTPTG
jgi:hypothetical protein